jgi:hypothetical protein
MKKSSSSLLSSTSSPFGKKKNPWTEEETRALIEGYQRYGHDWRLILDAYGHRLSGRTNVDLKDRARILRKHGIID